MNTNDESMIVESNAGPRVNAEKERLDVMIDVETLSTDRSKGLIVSVGLKRFSLFDDQKEYFENEFEWRIDVLSSLLAGRKVDENTLEWWQSRTDGQKQQLVGINAAKYTFEDAMKKIYDLLSVYAQSYDLIMWSKGTDFDFPMLESSMIDAGVIENESQLPYSYRNKRDVRTVVDTADLFCVHKDVTTLGCHSALEDCRRQVMQVKSAMRRLKEIHPLTANGDEI